MAKVILIKPLPRLNPNETPAIITDAFNKLYALGTVFEKIKNEELNNPWWDTDEMAFNIDLKGTVVLGAQEFDIFPILHSEAHCFKKIPK